MTNAETLRLATSRARMFKRTGLIEAPNAFERLAGSFNRHVARSAMFNAGWDRDEVNALYKAAK